MSRDNLIAKFAFGTEAVDDGLGTVCIDVNTENEFEVFVNGGTLPDGEDSKKFRKLSDAVDFATDIVKALTDEWID